MNLQFLSFKSLALGKNAQAVLAVQKKGQIYMTRHYERFLRHNLRLIVAVHKDQVFILKKKKKKK